MPIYPKTLISKEVEKGDGTLIGVDIRIYFTGSITFEITANADDASPTWDQVSLTSGELTNHLFTVQGDEARYRIVGSAGATIYKNGSNPAIYLRFKK